MSGRYDVVSKRLLEMRPLDWVRFLNLIEGSVSLIDTDLSTVGLAADRLIHVDAPTPYILHNEMESGHHTQEAPRRMLTYNAIVHSKTNLRVLSNLLVLRKESDSPQLTGQYVVDEPDGDDYLTFKYRVVRVWKLEVGEVLSSGLSVLPFAPITNVQKRDIPDVVKAMRQRIDSEVSNDDVADELWTATYILMGLKYDQQYNTQMLRGVRRMRESNTYQAILDEGRVEGKVEEAQDLLIRWGQKRLGAPDAGTVAQIRSIGSREQLESLGDRLNEVESWAELISPQDAE